MTFLVEKLRCMPTRAHMQRTLLCTWLLELFLDKLSELETAGDEASRARCERMDGAYTMEQYCQNSEIKFSWSTFCIKCGYEPGYDPGYDPDEARAAYAAELGRLLDGFLRPDARARPG